MQLREWLADSLRSHQRKMKPVGQYSYLQSGCERCISYSASPAAPRVQPRGLDATYGSIFPTLSIKCLVRYVPIYRTTSFSEAYLIFVSIKVWEKIFHQKYTNLVKFDLKEAIFSDFFNGI